MKIELSHKVFTVIAQAADNLNMEAYVIGGYVRDLILKRPSKDIDIVTTGKGIELAREVAKLLSIKQVSEYANFGTAMIKHQDLEIEFVGARKESYRKNSRKPICEDGTLQDDQNRRDFTINAMAIGLNKGNFAQLVDPFDGIRSLKLGELKTPLAPEQTYSDDPLRMMRAIRFACQLNFQIEDQSFEAISKMKDRIEIVSSERIMDEFNKIMLTKRPSIGIELLYDTGLLHHFFPELCNLQGVEVINGHGHKDNFYHTLQVLDNLAEKSEDLWLRWSALLHDIAKPPTKRFDKKVGWTFHGHEDLGAKMVPQIFKRLKLPLDQKMKYVQNMVKLHLRPIALVDNGVTDSAIRRLLYEAGDDIDDLMMLCESDVTTKNESKRERYKQNFKIVRKKLKEVEEKDHIRNWQPPVSGETIMSTFNIGPGPAVGILKNAIREAILDGVIQNNYEEAFSFMLKMGKEMDLIVANESAT